MVVCGYTERPRSRNRGRRADLRAAIQVIRGNSVVMLEVRGIARKAQNSRPMLTLCRLWSVLEVIGTGDERVLERAKREETWLRGGEQYP